MSVRLCVCALLLLLGTTTRGLEGWADPIPEEWLHHNAAPLLLEMRNHTFVIVAGFPNSGREPDVLSRLTITGTSVMKFVFDQHAMVAPMRGTGAPLDEGLRAV